MNKSIGKKLQQARQRKGLTQAEVAKRMGISLKTVEKHLRLGMSACREHLGTEVLS